MLDWLRRRARIIFLRFFKIFKAYKVSKLGIREVEEATSV